MLTVHFGVIVLMYVASLLNGTGAMPCYMGQEPDPSRGRYRWVIPVKNPCHCQRVNMGSVNTHAPNRTFNVTYYDTFLTSSDGVEIRKFLNCIDMPASPGVILEYGARWRMFWWWNGAVVWPSTDVVNDVLQDEYGHCESSAPYCFSRLPLELQEASAQMLGKDSAGNVYRWTFDPSNNTAHAVWLAFHDHKETKVSHGNTWNPSTLAGKQPGRDQDSFQYRDEHGVKSLQLDDDNCDWYTSLSIGHGMCYEIHNTQYSRANVFGVDPLYDDNNGPGPLPSNSLWLYFKDDDDCANTKCPAWYHCVDGVHSYTCI